MKRTIDEIENESGENFEDAIREYLESCIRVGKTDMEECARWYVRENNLEDGEYNRVLNSLKEALEEL